MPLLGDLQEKGRHLVLEKRQNTRFTIKKYINEKLNPQKRNIFNLLVIDLQVSTSNTDIQPVAKHNKVVTYRVCISQKYTMKYIKP